jgi:hypothetical protein
MDKKKLYESWIEKKNQVEINKSFPDKVMNQIYQYDQRPRWFDIQRLIDVISAHSIIKDGLVVAGVVAGFVRLAVMILMILNKGVING